MNRFVSPEAQERLIKANADASGDLGAGLRRIRNSNENPAPLVGEVALIAACPMPDTECRICIFGAPMSFERMDCPMLNATMEEI